MDRFGSILRKCRIELPLTLHTHSSPLYPTIYILFHRKTVFGQYLCCPLYRFVSRSYHRQSLLNLLRRGHLKCSFFNFDALHVVVDKKSIADFTSFVLVLPVFVVHVYSGKCERFSSCCLCLGLRLWLYIGEGSWLGNIRGCPLENLLNLL